MFIIGTAVVVSSILLYYGVQFLLRKNPKLKYRNLDKVAVVELHGSIGASNSDGLGFSQKMISFAAVKNEIDDIFTQPDLKALVLNINSPGGTPVQTERISNYIKDKCDKFNVPIFAFVEDIAASGGYWLACTANEIYASKCSVVGSIGVISSSFGFNKLINKYRNN